MKLTGSDTFNSTNPIDYEYDEVIGKDMLFSVR